MTLALFGGTAYVATRPTIPVEPVRLLLTCAGLVELVAGVAFSLFVISHQKSKIERWPNWYDWWKPLTWQECWMVVGMMVIATTFEFVFVPHLLKILGS